MPLIRFLCLTLLIVGSHGFALCGEGLPPAHPVVFSWNGLSDKERFNDAIKALHEQVARQTEHHYFATGFSSRNPANPIEPSWRPQIIDPNSMTIVLANREGLNQIEQEIQKHFDELKSNQKDKGRPFDPSEFELIFYVTNHGQKELDGPHYRYGIVGSPRDPKGHLLENKDAIWEEDLKTFASRLPKGIRVKAIFSQCYGANTIQSFLSSVNTEASCKCGLAKAEKGLPAWSSKADATWDHFVIHELARGSSLTEAGLSGFAHPQMGVSDNGSSQGLTTSQQFLLDALTKKPLGFTDESWDTESYELHAYELSKTLSKKPLSERDKATLLQLEQRDEALRVKNGITEKDWVAAQNYFKGSHLSTSDLRTSDQNGNRIYRQIYEKEHLDYLKKSIVPRRLFAYEKLREVFFHLSSEEEKKAYLELVACERDPLISPIAYPQKAESSSH